MDVERHDSGRWHFSLGVVEKWVCGVVAVAFIGAAYWFVSSVLNNQAETNKRLGEMATQQAVTNAQITTLSAQLADVPSLTRQIAELKVQTTRNAEDIQELRQVRRLK